jgi:hypothetical protein
VVGTSEGLEMFTTTNKELPSTSNTFMTDCGMRESEITPVDLFSGQSIEKMIKVELEFVTLIDVNFIDEESRRTDDSVVLASRNDFFITAAHEKFISESDDSLGVNFRH